MALTRKFSGKVYHFDSQHHNKLRAHSRAEAIRQRGGKARMVKVDFMTWEVWSREAIGGD